jgi:2-haloacid dehalogenase
MFPFLELFRHIVVSGKLKLVKPDAAIFRHLLDIVGKPAQACFFIDDSEKNVAGAAALGFHTHHFAEPSALGSDLDRLGFL